MRTLLSWLYTALYAMAGVRYLDFYTIHDVYTPTHHLPYTIYSTPSTLHYLRSFWRGIWTLMTRDIGLGPAQLLVILAMSLVLVIVMRWVVSLARKWYGNLNTSLNEGLMREMIEVEVRLLSIKFRSSLPPQQQRC